MDTDQSSAQKLPVPGKANLPCEGLPFLKEIFFSPTFFFLFDLLLCFSSSSSYPSGGRFSGGARSAFGSGGSGSGVVGSDGGFPWSIA